MHRARTVAASLFTSKTPAGECRSECWGPGGLSGSIDEVGTRGGVTPGRREWRHPKARQAPRQRLGVGTAAPFQPPAPVGTGLLSSGPGTGTGDVVMSPDALWAEAPPVALHAAGCRHCPQRPAVSRCHSCPLCTVSSWRAPSPALALPQCHGSGDVWHERSLCPWDVVSRAVPPTASSRKWARAG